jgi:hypothetical protein
MLLQLINNLGPWSWIPPPAALSLYWDAAFTLSNMRTMSLWKTLGLVVALGASAQGQCPDYTTYSQSPQGNPSAGHLKLPYMRPAPACRTFNSTAVEVRTSCNIHAQVLTSRPVCTESHLRHEGTHRGP